MNRLDLCSEVPGRSYLLQLPYDLIEPLWDMIDDQKTYMQLSLSCSALREISQAGAFRRLHQSMNHYHLEKKHQRWISLLPHTRLLNAVKSLIIEGTVSAYAIEAPPMPRILSRSLAACLSKMRNLSIIKLSHDMVVVPVLSRAIFSTINTQPCNLIINGVDITFNAGDQPRPPFLLRSLEIEGTPRALRTLWVPPAQHVPTMEWYTLVSCTIEYAAPYLQTLTLGVRYCQLLVKSLCLSQLKELNIGRGDEDDEVQHHSLEELVTFLSAHPSIQILRLGSSVLVPTSQIDSTTLPSLHTLSTSNLSLLCIMLLNRPLVELAIDWRKAPSHAREDVVEQLKKCARIQTIRIDALPTQWEGGLRRAIADGVAERLHHLHLSLQYGHHQLHTDLVRVPHIRVSVPVHEHVLTVWGRRRTHSTTFAGYYRSFLSYTH